MSQKAKWKWDETELKYPADTVLLVDDIKQVAITRDAHKRDLNKNKVKLIAYVTSNFDVDLTNPLEKLTNKQLLAELKLHGLNHKIANKATYISRLREQSHNKKHNDSNNDDNGKWLLQQAPPNYFWSSPMAIDNHHICVVTSDGFWKYNVVTKEWKSWLKFPGNKTYWNGTACFDNMNKRIFVHYRFGYDANGTKYRLLTLDINSEKMKIINHCYRIDEAKLVILHQQLHVIGKENHVWKHLILDTKTQSYSVLHTFDNIPIDYGENELIAVPSRNMLILIGPIMEQTYIYSSITQKWSASSLKLPTTVGKFAHAVSMNGRYLLLFGGKNIEYVVGWRRGSPHNDIYIIDLNVMDIKKSKIRCPLKSIAMEVVISRNILEEKLIVFGYVRKCWKSDKFSMMRMPPNYIICLILSWYSRGNVHLFEKGSGIHCVINIDHVFRDTSSY